MIIFHKKTELKKFLKVNVKNMKIGFVPTMGSIHKGHLSLIHESKKRGYFTCCSIKPIVLDEPLLTFSMYS